MSLPNGTSLVFQPNSTPPSISCSDMVLPSVDPVFMTGSTDGRTMSEQLIEGGVELGWNTRLVPFGKDITATIYALGFAARAALSLSLIHISEPTRLGMISYAV